MELKKKVTSSRVVTSCEHLEGEAQTTEVWNSYCEAEQHEGTRVVGRPGELWVGVWHVAGDQRWCEMKLGGYGRGGEEGP